MMKKLSLMMLTILSGLLIISHANADDTATFSSLAPDALILLDESDNMKLNPAGGNKTWGFNNECLANAACDSTNCADGFCTNSTDDADCATDCSRLGIAKRAIFDILDDNNDNVINADDATGLGIRFGLMRFRGGDDISNPPNYNSGTIALVKPIGSEYQSIFCGATTSCTPVATCASGECVANATASGGASLARAINEARLYLNYHKTTDTFNNAGDCRQKFVILITSSSDDCACVGSGDGLGGCETACYTEGYKRRNQILASAKTLYDAVDQTVISGVVKVNYPVYAVGFGGAMPDYLKNTLNWIARWGGTDNPLAVNSGDPSAFTPGTFAPSVCAAPTGGWGSIFSGVCESGSVSNWYAERGDPGNATNLPLSGYAFIAANAAELSYALKSAISTIREQTYSFTRVSVQTVRTKDENYLYEASFQPLATSAGHTNDPFWVGHLKRYTINTDGTLPIGYDWDAGTILKDRTATRNIYTSIGGSVTSFTNSINPTYFGLDSSATANRDAIVTFVYDGDKAYATANDNYGWRLGDIFHSSPISIGSPSEFFVDQVDERSPKAYRTYSDNHPRTSELGNRLIVAGANDGQFHVFRTGDKATSGDGSTGGGSELWSFIPPNLLQNLQKFKHTVHPTALTHYYFVDGPTTASDIWIYNSSSGSSTADGKAKDSDEWKAYMIISEGRGGSSTLWSKSSNCSSATATDFKDTYSITTTSKGSTTTEYWPYYCGYYAFDMTDSFTDDTYATGKTPTLLWHFGGTTALNITQGGHLGEPWSKITIGRVKINGEEKWVGFTAGGYGGVAKCNSCPCLKRGNGFYVIDLQDGSILWTFTGCGTAAAGSAVVNSNMKYSLTGQPASVDIDDDGFIETVYSGDLGGNIWRFKFCEKTDASAATGLKSASCDKANWTGGLFSDSASGSIRPIFTKPTVIHTIAGSTWVYWGTGDVNDPTAPNTQEAFYAMQDNDRTSSWTNNGSCMTNLNVKTFVTTDTCTNKDTGATVPQNGWYIPLQGEKILSDATVYADVAYFTSYQDSQSKKACDVSGDASLYAVDYLTGAGEYTTTDVHGATVPSRSTAAGTGIASGAVVSENPFGGTNIYVTTSEGARINPVQPPDPFANKANLQYWQDMRVK